MRECPYCHGDCTNNCPSCHGDGQKDCRDCYKKSGYRLVELDNSTWRFDEIKFENKKNQPSEKSEKQKTELGQQPVVLVNWEQRKTTLLESDWESLFNDLAEETSGTAALSDQKARRLADHARRLSQFEPLLEHLIEKQQQEVLEQKPIAFRGFDASAKRKGGRVVYEFLLHGRKGSWVKDEIDPFPPGSTVLFVPQATSSWRDAESLRWVKGFDPGPTSERLEATYLCRVGNQRRVKLLLSFPIAVDRESIPENGFLLASQPPPAEKAQLAHLQRWCGRDNRLNPVFQSVVFMDAPDTRPHEVKLHDENIRKTSSQLEAVRWGCSESPLVLVKGPPGTGKTTVIVEIIQQLAAQNRRVLLCSQTHQAVRNVLERLHGKKRIRMSRHQSGRDNKLSDLEREYLAGAVADTFEKDTLERAQNSSRAARETWERDGAQLRALEAARDAATELAEARQRLPQQHVEVDASVDQSLLDLSSAAEKQKGEHGKQHDDKTRKLRERLESLRQEREWVSEMASSLMQRFQNLGVVTTEPPPSSSTGDSKSDIDESDAVVGHRYRELFLNEQRHDARNRLLDAGVDSLQKELRTLDKEKESKITEAEDKASSEVATIETNEEEAVLLTSEKAAHEREIFEELHTRLIADIADRYKQSKASARLEVSRRKKACGRATAHLERTTKKKERIAERYESITGKRPRVANVGTRSWFKSKLPMMWIDQEELHVRYSVLRNEERNLQAKCRELRAETVSLQSELDDILRQEERDTEDAQADLAKDRGRIDKKEHQELEAIHKKEDGKRHRVLASRDKKVQAAVSDWENKRGHKPAALDALQLETRLESRILKLTRDGLARLESRISDRARVLESTRQQAPTDEETAPDGEAGADEKTRRVEACRGYVALLRTRVEYCETAETSTRNDIQANDDWLADHLDRIDLGLQGDIEREEKRRRDGHAAVQVAFEATELRCQEHQSKALGFADGSMSNDEPPGRWECLADPIRPAVLRLKEKSQFLRRWVQDIEASMSAIRKLHWANIDVFLSTCVGVNSWRELIAGGREAVDTVIIDEAAHATVPETLIPMLYGRRCILIGDEMQLPPISMEKDLPPMPTEEWIATEELPAERNRQKKDSREFDTSLPLSENWLERTLFEWLYLYRPALPRQMLNKQFRMHPEIAGFISQVFYPEGLHDGVTPSERRLSFGEHTEAVCLRQTDAIEENFEEKVGETTGFRNPCEADIVLEILRDAEQNLDIEGYRQDLVSWIRKNARENPDAWPKARVDAEVAEAMQTRPTFGVITPYAHQKTYIKNKLRRVLSSFQNLDMSADDDIGSVDSYQGSERDVIIISFVRSPRTKPKACRACKGEGDRDGVPCEQCAGHGWAGANLAFVRDLRRLNVALSRAKRMLILVGNFSALVDQRYRGNDEGGRILDGLRRYIEDHGHVFLEHEAGYAP
jgi:superfamily I DNA and/or RNA helicase